MYFKQIYIPLLSENKMLGKLLFCNKTHSYSDCVIIHALLVTGYAKEALIRSGHANGELGRGNEKINGLICGYGSPMA